MTPKTMKRIAATEAQTELGRIVQEVATTGEPVIIEDEGDDQAALVSLRDLKKLQPAGEAPPGSERQRVRAALRAAGLLSEPTAQEIAEVEAFEAKHSPEDRERILAELRGLHLHPPLSEIILRNRGRELG
jgi:prevent-host-death family protein